MRCRWLIANDLGTVLSLSASGCEIALPPGRPRNRRCMLLWLLTTTPWFCLLRKTVSCQQGLLVCSEVYSATLFIPARLDHCRWGVRVANDETSRTAPSIDPFAVNAQEERSCHGNT